MRQALTTAGELTGAAVLSLGAGLIYFPAGLICAGGFLGLFSWLAAR